MISKDQWRLVLITFTVLFFLLWIFPRLWWSAERRYEVETDAFYDELKNILKEHDESNRVESLKNLAKKLGAGYERTDIGGTVKIGEESYITQQNPISESELAQNIHDALQTRTMISAAKATAKSYVVAFLAAAAAVISAGVSVVVLRTSSREKLKANIKHELNHRQKHGRYELVIKNIGPAEAREVEPMIDTNPLTDINSIEPKIQRMPTIAPGSLFTFHWKTSDTPNISGELKIIWSDNSGKPGCYVTTLQHPTRPT